MLGVVVVAFVLAYAGVLASLVRAWTNDENYSHGFLVVPIAGYLVWQRRARLSSATRQPSALGLPILVASLALLLAGVLGAEVFAARVSMLGVLAGSVLFVYGWQHLAILAFPLGLLLLAIPVPALVFNQVALPLQLLASRLGQVALALTGVPALREGNVITLAHIRLEVAEACSGIRSLVSLLTLAILYGYFADDRAWRRVALALVAIPVAIVVNGLRIAGTGVLGERLGTEAAQGFFHAFSGWLMFLVAFALLVGVHRVLVAMSRRNAARRDTTPARMAGQRAVGRTW